MTILRTGIFCLVYCAIALAQQDFADLQQIDPATGKPVPGQPAPAVQQAPPPAQQQPPATAPAQQPAAPSPVAPPEPLQQQPGPPSGPIISAPPELPKYPDVRMPGEAGWSIGIDLWTPKEHPTFDRGRAATFPQPSLITMQGSPKYSYGIDLGIAIGLHNKLRVSYFTARSAGDFVTTQDITAWDQTYLAGTLVSTNYTEQNLKLSFDYLTWPYPVESRRFRLLTLWQLQYMSVRSVFDAPALPLVDSTGAPLLDSNGNPISYAGEGTRWFLTPTFGLGVHEYFTKNFRFEVNGDGFAIPHHWTIWDADTTLNYRVGHFEVRAGLKAFHYKTSTNAEFFLKNTMISPMLALRWYSD